MAKTYTKTRVKATEAMLLISEADRILAKDRLILSEKEMYSESHISKFRPLKISNLRR